MTLISLGNARSIRALTKAASNSAARRFTDCDYHLANTHYGNIIDRHRLTNGEHLPFTEFHQGGRGIQIAMVAGRTAGVIETVPASGCCQPQKLAQCSVGFRVNLSALFAE